MTFPRSIASALACAGIALAPAAVLAQQGLRLPGADAPSGLRAPAAPPAGPTSPAASPARAPSGDAPAETRRGPVAIDRIVAVVNSEVVTARELDQRIALVTQQLRRQNVELPPREVLERQVLERIIIDRAQVQFARESGLRVDDAIVDRAIGRIAEENRLTVNEFRDRVERDGVPFSRFREDVREEIVSTRLREREVDARVQVTDAEIDAFLAEQAGAPGTPTEYLIAQILLRVPENASPEQIERQRLRAEELARQLAGGGDFGRLAAAFSDAPEALSGGLLGWRPAERLPQLFVDAVAKLQPGDVSPVLRSANGFHILRLADRRQPTSAALTAPVMQTKARHILIRVNELVSEAEARRRLQDIRARVQNGGDFAELARQFSNDGSAGRGGDLGWIYPGDTVPEFERAMGALQPNQVSEPVRTPFGFHLIQVLERRTDSASPERTRLLARQAVRERKIDEAWQDWLRQLRDRTYVELRPE